MLEREFKELTGLSESQANEEYVCANAMYMSTDMNKEDFCKEWTNMKKNGNRLAMEFFGYIERQSAMIRDLQKRNGELQAECDRLSKERDEAQVRHEQEVMDKECVMLDKMEEFKHYMGEQLVDALYAKSDEQTIEQVRKVAIGLCAPEHYLCHITKQGYDMLENDKNLLVEILSNIG